MPKPTDFKSEMEAEDRRAWLAGEYNRLKEEAMPLVTERNKLLASLKAVESLAESIARRAYGVLLCMGKDEGEAAKEIAKWRKPEG